MAPLVVKQLPVLPRNGWSKVRWSDDPSHQALRVWRDADADISEMFYLPMDTDDDDNEGPIEWIAVTPSDTPFFFPPGQKEEGFYYQTDFRAWLARYVSKKTRDSDIYKARHFSMPVGKDGISVARLAVSPALFLACCLEKFKKKSAGSVDIYALQRFVEDRSQVPTVGTLTFQLEREQAANEKLKAAAKTAKEDGGREAIDALLGVLTDPEVANNMVLGCKIPENALRELLRSLEFECHALNQKVQFENHAAKEAKSAAAAMGMEVVGEEVARIRRECVEPFITFDHLLEIDAQPTTPHNYLPKSLRSWSMVNALFQHARSYVNRYVVDGPSGEDDVFQDIAAGKLEWPKHWDGWTDIVNKESPVKQRVQVLFETVGVKAHKRSQGTYIRAAVELMTGVRFGREVRRPAQRRTIETVSGHEFEMPRLNKILDVCRDTREQAGVGCIEVTDIYEDHETPGGPEIEASHISFEGCANFDYSTIAGSSTIEQIQRAARTGLHDCGVRRNIQTASEPGTPVPCFMRNVESALQLQLCKLEHMFAKQLHSHPVPADHLNADGELEVTLRGVFWFDGSTKAAQQMSKIMMRMFTRKDDQGVQDLFGANVDIALAHEIKKWLWLFESWECGEHGHAYLSLGALIGCWMEQVMNLNFVLTLAGQKVRFKFHCLHISADLKALEGLMGYMQSGPNKNVFVPVNMNDALEHGLDAFNLDATSVQDILDACEKHVSDGTALAKGQLRTSPLVKDYKKKATALGILAKYLPWEKTHLLNTVKNLFYHIYDLKMCNSQRAQFDLRYEKLTGRAGFKSDNWLSDFREALMQFEGLFAGLLGIHQTKIERALNHLRNIILLMSLDADSIDAEKIDLCRLSCFAYFTFVFDAIKSQYLPADKLFNNYLLYTCIIFPRSYGTDDDKLCHQEIEAEGAEGTWAENNRHILFNSMRGGGRYGGLINDLKNHLMRQDREHNLRLRWGRLQSATKGSMRARGVGVTSKAIAAGAFAPDFRLIESELNTPTMRKWLATWLTNSRDGAHLQNRPELIGLDGSVLTEEQLADGAVLTELQYRIHPEAAEFVPDTLPTEDRLKTAYRKTTTVVFSEAGRHRPDAIAAEQPPPKRGQLHHLGAADNVRPVAEAADIIDPQSFSVAPRGHQISYRVKLERKHTCEDGQVRTVKSSVSTTPLTNAQLEKMAALFLEDVEGHHPVEVRKAAHQAIKVANGDKCHAKLASFKGVKGGESPQEQKLDFVSWLYKRWGWPTGLAGSSDVMGGKILTAGWDDKRFDDWGVDEEIELPTFAAMESSGDGMSVLEQVRAGALVGAEVEGIVQRQQMADWSSSLGEFGEIAAGGGMQRSAGGRKHSMRLCQPNQVAARSKALGADMAATSTFDLTAAMETTD